MAQYRDPIDEAVATLHLDERVFRRLSRSFADHITRTAEAAFVSKLGLRWWWDSLKHPMYSEAYRDGTGFWRMLAFCPTPDEHCWFIAADGYGDDHWPVFEALPEAVSQVLGQCYHFEYYLVDKSFNWLICEMHHDVVIFALSDTGYAKLNASGEGGVHLPN